MRLVQVTDCHLHADPEARSRTGVPYRQWQRVLDEIARFRPDHVLVSGDVSQDDSLASYRLARQSLAALACPWVWLPGNHDVPEWMQQLAGLPGSVDLGARRLLLLDTRLPGEARGALGRDELARLASCLREATSPVLIAMHHPPLPVGSDWIDALGLTDASAFWQVLEEHGSVEAIFCGHVHQAFEARYVMPGGEGVPVYACPATSDQFLPGAREFAVDEDALPGFRVIDIDDNSGSWSTRVVRVPLT